MTYELTVNKNELGDIIQGLANDFQDCWEHVSDLRCFDENSREEFKCTMEVGRLMERLIFLYEFGEAHLSDDENADNDVGEDDADKLEKY